MEDWPVQIWDWLGDEDHRERLLVILPVLALIGGLIRWLVGLFRRGSGGGQRASGGSVNVGRDVGGDVNLGARGSSDDDPS